MMIVTDENLLRKPSLPVKSLKEGLEIGRKLNRVLAEHNKRAIKTYRKVASHQLPEMFTPQFGVGLSAPQIGIYKQVFVMQYNGRNNVLINPELISHGTNKVVHYEGCLSFPGKEVKTERFSSVTFNTLNQGIVTFGSHFFDKEGIMSAVVAQHEYDHLQGILFFDRAYHDNYTNATAV